MLLKNLRSLAIRLERELWVVARAAQDRRTPWYAKLLVVIVVAYALSPIDLIPDFIPVLGWLDDLILIPIGIALAIRWIPEEVLADCREGRSSPESRPESQPSGHPASHSVSHSASHPGSQPSSQPGGQSAGDTDRRARLAEPHTEDFQSVSWRHRGRIAAGIVVLLWMSLGVVAYRMLY